MDRFKHAFGSPSLAALKLYLVIGILLISRDGIAVPAPDRLAFIGPHFEVYAPDQANLDEGVTAVDSAFHRISRFLGEAPPKIGFLLFNSNAEILAYDFSELVQRKLFFMPWLTTAGAQQAQNQAGVAPVRSIVTVSRNLSMRNYREMGICVEKIQSGKIGVTMTNKLARELGFQEGDVLLQINGEKFSDLNAFDQIYAGIPVSAKIKLDIFRNGNTKSLRFRKTVKKDEWTEWLEKNYNTEIEMPEGRTVNQEVPTEFPEIMLNNPISHEAGHLFLIAYTDFVSAESQRNEITTALFDSSAKFYGHPLIPDWLDEAAAIACETVADQRSRIAGAKAHPDKLTPLAEFVVQPHPGLGALKSGDNSFYYSQSIAFATYLREKAGTECIRTIIQGAIAGQDFASVLPRAQMLPADFGELEADFRQWLAGE